MDFSQQLSRKRDDITKILNQRTKPGLADVANAATQRSLAIIDPARFKNPGSLQDVTNATTSAELAPHLQELDQLQKAADAGHADSKALLETFSKFAPDPDQLNQLVQAASSAPEEITPLNAATFAANFASQNKFGESARRIREAGVAEAEAKPRAVEALVGARNRANTGISKGSMDGSKMPIILPNADENGKIMPPTIPGQTPDMSLFDSSGTKADNQTIATHYQGASAPPGQMFVKGPQGVSLAPIPRVGAQTGSGKPITASQAGQLAMVKQGMDAIPDIKNLMFNSGSLDSQGNLTPKASLDKTTLTQMIHVPLVGEITLSQKARKLWTAFYNMANAKLRLESGAAVPDSEVRRTAQAYIAGILDSPETAMYKLQAPEKYFHDYQNLVGKTSVEDPASTQTNSYKSKYGLE